MQVFLKGFLKVVFWVLVALLILVLAAFFSFPKIVSTDKGKEFTLNWINKSIPGKIEVGKVDLNWFSGQTIENFSLYDASGKQIFVFDSFTTGEKLFNLILNRYRLGETKLLNPYLYLEENAQGELNLKKAIGEKKETKKKKERKRPCFKGKVSIVNGKMDFVWVDLDPIVLSDINIEVQDSFDLFHIVAKTEQGLSKGEILASGKLDDDFHILATATNLPVVLIDQFKKTDWYEPALGSQLNFQIELNKREENVTLDANISSANLKGNFKGITKDNMFYLEKGDVVFTVTPVFFKTFFKTKEWELANKPQFILNIDKLIFPLELKKPDFKQIPLFGKAVLERVEMTHGKLGSLSLNNFVVNFETEQNININYSGSIQGKGEPTNLNGDIKISPHGVVSFNSLFKSLPTDFLELVMSADLPYLHKILGDQFTLSVDGVYDKEIESFVTLNTSNFDIKGKLEGESICDLKANMTGEAFFPKKWASFIGPPPKITLIADISCAERTLAIPYLSLKMKNPNIDLDIKGKLGEKDKPFDYKDVKIVGTGVLHRLPIYRDVIDYQGHFTVQFDGEENKILGSANLKSVPRGEESIQLNLYAVDVVQNNELKIEDGKYDLRGKVANFPLHFFDSFLDYKIKFYHLLGPYLDLDVAVHHEKGHDKVTSIDLEAKSMGFYLKTALLSNSTFDIRQDQPTLLHWELNPSRYQYLMQLATPDRKSEYELEASSMLDIKLDKLKCPKVLPDSFKNLFCSSGFFGDVTMTPLSFVHPTGNRIVLNNIQGSISSENIAKETDFTLKGDIETSSIPTGGKSGFSFDIETLNLLTSEGTFNKDLKIKGEVSLDLIPMKEMNALIPLKPETRRNLNAMIGPLLNAKIYGEIDRKSGPLTVDIKGSNFKGVFPLNFTPESLTLRSNVESELTLTQEVNEILLKDVNPLLITGAWSDQPIKLYVQGEGFYVHLNPFSIQGVKIEKAVIDFGKLRVRNGGDIQQLTKFLKARDVNEQGIMEAWFTPIFMSLNDGVATYKRFDALLAGNVHIALWGQIDLVKDKVKMILGISPSTIGNSFNIKGLSNKEMFQVKMRGSTSDLDLDWSSASTRIGILVTKSTAGHLGLLIGGILEQLIGILGEEPTPPPTVHPFPWESNVPPQSGMPVETTFIEEDEASFPLFDLLKGKV